jgi:hypothetical protein
LKQKEKKHDFSQKKLLFKKAVFKDGKKISISQVVIIVAYAQLHPYHPHNEKKKEKKLLVKWLC